MCELAQRTRIEQYQRIEQYHTQKYILF